MIDHAAIQEAMRRMAELARASGGTREEALAVLSAMDVDPEAAMHFCDMHEVATGESSAGTLTGFCVGVIAGRLERDA